MAHTEQFVENISDPYITALKTPPQLSSNAKCGRMISRFKGDAPFHAGSRSLRDSKVHRTTAGVWAIRSIVNEPETS